MREVGKDRRVTFVRAPRLCVALAIFFSLTYGARAALGASSPTATSAPSTIVAVTGDVPERLASRLRTELGARGFSTEIALPCHPRPQDIASWPCDTGIGAPQPFPTTVAALLRVTTTGGKIRIEIWTRPAATEAPELRTTLEGTNADDLALPVRGAENTRTFLRPQPAVAVAPLPLPTSSPPSASPTTSTSTASAATPSSGELLRAREAHATDAAAAHASDRPVSHHLSLGLDAALLLPRGAASGGSGAMLRARIPVRTFLATPKRIPTDVAVGLRTFLPLAEPTVSNDMGRADLAARLFGAEAHTQIRSPDPDGHWVAGLSLGVALAWLRTTGLPSTPFSGHRDDVVTAMPFASAEIARSLGQHLGLRAGALVGMATPPITVRFAGQPVSTWGRPLTSLSLGLDVAL